MGTENTLEQRTGTLYQRVVFEPRADYDGSNKKLYTFDKSLERLRAIGQVRHPRPQEVFSLLIANLENKLTDKQKAVADDMLNSYGEWLSAATERHGDTLTVYTDPVGLVWDVGQYVKQNFLFAAKKEFNIQGIPSQSLQDLHKFHPDFVNFMYTRPFDKLPQEMREGNRRAQVYLPADGEILPVGRGIGYSISYVRASRGVVPSSRAKKLKKLYHGK